MSAPGFPRGVVDPFCSQDHPLDEISTDRRLLWHLELVLSGGPEYQRDTARAVARYLHDSCEHHWTKPDGGSFVRACLDEDDARETVEAWPGRAQVVCREVRVGPWTAVEAGRDAASERQLGGQ